MVDDRWGSSNDLVIKEDTLPSSSIVAGSTSTSITNNNSNGTKQLPVPQNRIPKIVKSAIEISSIPKEQDIQDREKLRSQLTSLQALLEKTSKKGGDILRSYKGRDLNQHPSYAENLKLQQDVEKRIEEVKGKLFEISKRIGTANKEVKNTEDAETNLEPVDVAIKSFAGVPIYEDDDISDKNFIDPGMHWCKQCDIFISDLPAYLKHLTTEKHWKISESKEEPWRRTDNRPKIEVDPAKKRDTDILGVHTLVAIRGYFCQVCGILLGSPSHAEDHLKTNTHYRCYNRQKLMNSRHEYNYSIDKSRALTKFQSQERKRQKEQEEKEEREKEAKRRATELEMKKRILKEKLDEENRLKKSRDSQEKTQDRNFKELSRNQDRDRDRDRDRERHKEKDKERDRDRDRDRERDRDKDRDKERISKSFSSKFSNSKDKDHRDRDRDRNREKERELKHKLKHSNDGKSKSKSEHSTIIEKIEDENVFGPHWPFQDQKLSMKTLVLIPKKEWQLCYKKHIKLMMKGRIPTLSSSTMKKQKESQESNNDPDSTSDAKKVKDLFALQPEEPDNVDSSIGDLVLAITSDRGGGMSDSDLDNHDAQKNDFNSMFTVEYDDDEEKSCKIKTSDFVVTQDIDFTKMTSSIAMEDGSSSLNGNQPLSCDTGHRFELEDDDQMEVENGHDVFFSDARKPSPVQEMEEDEPFKLNDKKLNGASTLDPDSLTSPTDDQMLSPPIWVQPLSLHDLAE